jgi:hypothetical protein
MNYELKIRQSFAKLRRILGTNYVGKGRIKSVRRGRRGILYRRGGGSPLGGAAAQGEILLPLHGGNPLINMR